MAHGFCTTICNRSQKEVNGQLEIFAIVNGQAKVSLSYMR